MATLPELLRQSDFVSLHAPSTPETFHLIGESELRLMKPTAYLINTSRGALDRRVSTRGSARQEVIAGAALDVLDDEPPRVGHPLLLRADVIVTPHSAFYSEESIDELTQRAAEQVLQALRGETPSNIVNPQVLEQRNCRLVA